MLYRSWVTSTSLFQTYTSVICFQHMIVFDGLSI